MHISNLRRPALKNWQIVDYFTNEPKDADYVQKIIDRAKEFGSYLCEDLNIAIKGDSVSHNSDLYGRANKLLALRATREELIAITVDYQEIIAC